MLDICFVAPYAWPILSGSRSNTVFGGAEVKLVTLAKGMAARGHRVSMVVLDFGQEDRVIVDGVTAYKAHRPSAGIPALRFLHPRLTGMWQAMKRSNAQCYIQSSCGALTGIVGGYARAKHRKFIYIAASDADFDKSLPLIRFARDRWLYLRGLLWADKILVQTARQKVALKAFSGRHTEVIPNALGDPPGPASSTEEPVVLWAARMIDLKRPALFVQLARRLPAIPFVMCGGTAEELTRILAKTGDDTEGLPGNLKVVGAVPFSLMDEYFNKAAILVNTSLIEGLPNTFLQAWVRSVPSVSFFNAGFDPESRLGQLVVPDLDTMVSRVDQFMSDTVRRKEIGRACRQHFEAVHSLPNVLAKLETQIRDL